MASPFKSVNGRASGAVSAPSRDVPIIGQPFTIEGWHFSLVIRCKCTPEGRVILVTNREFVGCQDCLKAYMIGGVQYSHESSPQFQLACKMPPAAAPSPPKEIAPTS